MRIRLLLSFSCSHARGLVCWVVLSVAVAALGLARPALATITPASVIDGPSPSILGVGNVAMANDGTGGMVWRRLAGGVAHIFVSPYRDGRWGAPIEVDAGQAGPATFPAIAAGAGGELLVVWVAPWASESAGGNTPTAHYQLVSAVMQPGASGFGPPMQVDPTDVADGSGVFPSLAMAPNGTAYVIYRVVTNPLSPDQPQPPGTLQPMRPGDELVDVRAARFNGLFWSSLRTLNRLPGQVTMRKPTAANAPVIAVDRLGEALAVWQEPSIDGVARIWARRLFGTTQGFPLAVSPAQLSGHPVSADADAPSLALNDYAGAKAAFRLAGGAGSPLGTPHVLVNTLPSGLADSAQSFTGAVSIGGAPTVGAPSVAVDDNGDFQAGFTQATQTALVSGDETSAGAPQALGQAAGDPAFATLDPDGGGAEVWPSVDRSGRPVVDVRETLPDGGYQQATLSAAISGPVSSLTIGPSGQGDALLAFRQGLGSTSQIAVATIQAPPHGFFAYTPPGWARGSRTTIRWDPASNVIGSVSYAVVIDGQVRASQVRDRRYRLGPGVGDGVHTLQILATDSAGQRTLSGAAKLKIDANPPVVTVRPLSARRIRVRVRDRASGPRAKATVVSFGDGTRALRHALSALHRYRRPGRYLVTVRCADRSGNRAVDRLLVQVR